MKILIINPPYPIAIIREGRCQSPQNMRSTSIPPMTLAYLSSILSRGGHQLKVFDCIADCMTNIDIFNEMDPFHPELALINTTTPSINYDLFFIREFKERYPYCFTTVFGTHVTATHEKIMKENEFIDAVIRHEPEWTAIELASILSINGTLQGMEVLGCTLRQNGEVIVCPEREYNSDLDSLGFPAWEYFNKSNYIHPIFNKPYTIINSSRGCVHRCIFCVGHVYYGRKVRYRSIDSIIHELEDYILGKLNIRYVWMYADDFTHSPEFVKELCSAIIKRDIKITWWTNTRVDKCDVEMYQLMKKAGCYMLSIGGESGNMNILRTIKKGTNPKDIKETVRILRKVGINSLVYFLIGLPGETRETVQETCKLAKEINPDYVEFYPATPYPGTEFFNIAERENLIEDRCWDNYMCGGNRFVVKIPGIKQKELNKVLRNAYKKFYLRPAYSLILLKRIIKPIEFFRLLHFGIRYFKRFITH